MDKFLQIQSKCTNVTVTKSADQTKQVRVSDLQIELLTQAA